MASTQFHEAAKDLRPETRDMHRAISSLMEELEAIDWYQQRVQDLPLRRRDVHQPEQHEQEQQARQRDQVGHD